MNKRELANLNKIANVTKFPYETFTGLQLKVIVSISITAQLAKLKQLHLFLHNKSTSNEFIEQKIKKALKPQHRHAEIGHRMCQYYVREELKIQKSLYKVLHRKSKNITRKCNKILNVQPHIRIQFEKFLMSVKKHTKQFRDEKNKKKCRIHCQEICNERGNSTRKICQC